MPRKKGHWKPKKSTSTNYSVEERAKVVGQLEIGASEAEIIQRTGMHPDTIKRIQKNTTKLAQSKISPGVGVQGKRLKVSLQLHVIEG